MEEKERSEMLEMADTLAFAAKSAKSFAEGKMPNKERIEGRIIEDQFYELTYIYERVEVLQRMVLSADISDRANACLDIVRCTLNQEVKNIERLLKDFCEKFSGLEYTQFS